MGEGVRRCAGCWKAPTTSSPRRGRGIGAAPSRPGLLVLREPTEGIQPSIIKDIGRAIRFLKDEAGLAILLVEQYLGVRRELADKVYIMDRGEIVSEGKAEDLDRPQVRRHRTV